MILLARRVVGTVAVLGAYVCLRCAAWCYGEPYAIALLGVGEVGAELLRQQQPKWGASHRVGRRVWSDVPGEH